MKLRPATLRDSWPIIWAAITGILVVACTSLVIALVSVSHASRTAECTNTALGQRNDLTARDHANERQKIVDQLKATKDETAGLAGIAVAKTPKDGMIAYRQFQKGAAEFEKALIGWLARDAAIGQQRRAHPLGRC